jgi:hypothetical protein
MSSTNTVLDKRPNNHRRLLCESVIRVFATVAFGAAPMAAASCSGDTGVPIGSGDAGANDGTANSDGGDASKPDSGDGGKLDGDASDGSAEGGPGDGGSDGGTCVQGTPCDDGDSCTHTDLCDHGTCQGQPENCSAPSGPTCVDDYTLRTFSAGGSCSDGLCAYPYVDQKCPYGCGTNSCAPCVTMTTTIASTGDVGRDSSIALDPNGEIFVSYYDASSSDLRLAQSKDGYGWSTSLVDGTGYVGIENAIAISATTMRIAYYDSGNDQQKIATRFAGGAWSIQAQSGTFSGQNNSLVYDGQIWHLTYYNSGSDTLSYRIIDPAPAVASISSGVSYGRSSLAVHAGKAHVTYAKGGLFHASRAPGGQFLEALIDAGAVNFSTGLYSAITVDSSGMLHVAYDRTVVGGGNSTLYYAWNPTGSSSQWSTQSIETGGGTGKYVSIKAGPANDVRIAYVAEIEQSLKYATKAAGTATWIKTTLDTGGAGGNTSMVVDSLGTTHISYYDATKHTLKYARVCQ